MLINITGGSDLTLYEVDEAASLIRSQVDPEANIIVGSAEDSSLDGIVRVSVVATGVQAEDGFNIAAPSLENTVMPPVESFEEEAVDISDIMPEEHEEISEAVVAQNSAQETPGYQYYRPEQRQEPRTEIEPVPTPAPVLQTQASLPPLSAQTVVKPLMGFFGRKKTAPAPRVQQDTSPKSTGDLFGAEIDDELEIPSFLRRLHK